MLNGPEALGGGAQDSDADSSDSSGGDSIDWSAAEDPRFIMGPDDTLAGLLQRYAEVARRTDETVATLDLRILGLPA